MDGEGTPELQTAHQLDFPVIGIGASAGGLEAVTTMFHRADASTGMAYVLVMHLDPDHESLMAELLSRKTHVQVSQIADGDNVEVNCLHVIPPGSSLRIENGKFRLDPFSEPRGLRRPIDSFFTSLANTQGDKCGCVVLSGTGADGTAGLRYVKEMGGVCAVQSPEEARYDGMPFSALSTKVVDFTLPADEIIPRIKMFFDGIFSQASFEENAAVEDAMSQIFGIIKQSVGHDFKGYKRSTLYRRLIRRMQVQDISKVSDYVDFLRVDETEQVSLAEDFLINVTSFFRDRENFELLRQTVIKPMIEKAELSDEVRIWVPGCSSGQEAYTIAMMIDETCQELKRRPLIQIFATDIDDAMLTQARIGQYPASAFAELPKRYQEAYTFGLDGKFEIVVKIREMMRFSTHNLIQDPPFSKIDLISCRNLLIYLGEELQSGLLPLMHFSLKPGGHLFLGTSENVTKRAELFMPIDQRARIFRKQATSKRVSVNLPLGGNRTDFSGGRATNVMAEERDFPRHQSLDATNALIYEEYAPPFIRVTSDGRIIDSSGDLSLFLQSRPGEDRNFSTLARDSIRDVAVPLIADAIKRDRKLAIRDIEVVLPYGSQKVDLIAQPMRDQTCALIFLVKDRFQPILDEFEVSPVTPDRRVADLQDELQATRLVLKGKVEEIETANEELKSSNEEMMSMNEELQSANEELSTANEELKNKIDELSLVNADLDNFLQSADLAMIVLDKSMRVRHVTDAARNLVPIMRSDQGRSLTEFNVSFTDFDVIKETRGVLQSGASYSSSTEPSGGGPAVIVRITPYFFHDGTVDGATITMMDISSEAELRREATLQAEKLGLAMEAGRIGFAELNLDRDLVTVDQVVADHLGLSKSGEMTFEDLFVNFDKEDVPVFRRALKMAGDAGGEYEIDFRINAGDDHPRWVRTRGRSHITPGGDKVVVGPIIDITAEKLA
ncbi:MAG: CheR family methyltransferase [Pseudomonadota bacterium]